MLILVFKKALLFLGLFAFFFIPGLLSFSSQKPQPIEISYQKSLRKLASKKTLSSFPAQRECETAERWRYRCKSEKKCVKDRKETYLKCRAL
jgi:hypothetical protein